MHSQQRARKKTWAPFGLLRVCLFVVWTASLPIVRSNAQGIDKAAAEQTAGVFWVGFDRDDLSGLYRSLSPNFRSTTTEQQFVQLVGMMRIQAGGPAQSRSIVGSQLMTDMPGAPKGDYFYVRYKSKYPNGFVFQDAYLEKADSLWRVLSYNVLAAPSD
jgi:hypothetical protein